MSIRTKNDAPISNTVTDHSRVTVFEPSGKPMKVQYPELNDIEEFANLTESQLQFSWYWAHPTSEFYLEPQLQVKISKCYDKAFGNKAQHGEKRLYLTQAFPPGMDAAFLRWKVFANDERAKAAYGYKNTLKNYDFILEQWENNIKKAKKNLTLDDMKMWDEYVDISAKINKERPLLIEKIESLGVNMNSKSVKGKEVSLNIMDRALEQVQQKQEDIT